MIVEVGARPATRFWSWSRFDREAWSDLAAFVSPDELPIKARVAGDPILTPSADRDSRLQAVRRICSLFFELRPPVQNEPWTADGRQRIRDPEIVFDEGGTCLDFSIAIATMGLSIGLRPYLLIDPAWTQAEGHAVVGFSLQVPADPGISGRISALDSSGLGWGLMLRSEIKTYVDAGRLVVLDVARACAHPSSPGSELLKNDAAASAKEYGTRFLDSVSRANLEDWQTGDVAVIDVVVASSASGKGPAVLDKSCRPAITRALPVLTDWLPYPSRLQLVMECIRRLKVDENAGAQRASHQLPNNENQGPLTAQLPGLVVTGKPGAGKSRIAYEVAQRLESGAVWWLTASDSRTLRQSLSKASARESGRALAEDDAGRDEEAIAGLARLGASRMPWLVVLDNANCEPASLPLLPEPRAHLGQRLLVTTLPEYAEAWKEWLAQRGPVATRSQDVVLVPDLTSEDLSLGGEIPAVVAHDFDRSVLMLRCFQALTRRHSPPEVATAYAKSEGEGMRRYWQAFCLLEPELVAPVTLAAWLPPDGIPEGFLDGAAPELLASGIVSRSFVRLGTQNLVDLHRSIGAQIRALDPTPATSAAGVVLDHRLLEHVDNFADGDTLDHLALALAVADSAAPGPRRLGTALISLAEVLESFGSVVLSRTSGTDKGWSAEEVLLLARERQDISALERAHCLHGLARAINQDQNRSQPVAARKDESEEETLGRERENTRRLRLIDGALDLTREATELRRGDRMLFARTRALEALLLKKRARFLSKKERLALLREAHDLLVWSANERRAVIHARLRAEGVAEDRLDFDREVARAIYNLAGSASSLAAAIPQSDQPERSARLAEAEATYTQVRHIREVIYGKVRIHPHVLACIRGQALIHYQRSWLLDMPMADRLQQLRAAQSLLGQVLNGDELLDIRDGVDVCKTLNLVAKVAEMRMHISSSGDVDRTLSVGASERRGETALRSLLKPVN